MTNKILSFSTKTKKFDFYLDPVFVDGDDFLDGRRVTKTKIATFNFFSIRLKQFKKVKYFHQKCFRNKFKTKKKHLINRLVNFPGNSRPVKQKNKYLKLRRNACL